MHGYPSTRARCVALRVSIASSSSPALRSVPPTRGPVESPQTSVGANPSFREPEKQLIPVVQVAEAKGWPAGMKPMPATELAVNAFATGLAHPRWLYVLPNGDVLVAETNAPDAAR